MQYLFKMMEPSALLVLCLPFFLYPLGAFAFCSMAAKDNVFTVLPERRDFIFLAILSGVLFLILMILTSPLFLWIFIPWLSPVLSYIIGSKYRSFRSTRLGIAYSKHDRVLVLAAIFLAHFATGLFMAWYFMEFIVKGG